ncbi:unnamed protein product [Choristocarpus tenellus]
MYPFCDPFSVDNAFLDWHVHIPSCTPRSFARLHILSNSFALCFVLLGLNPPHSYLWNKVAEVPGLDLYGPPPSGVGDNRNPLVSFNSRDVHASDLSFFLDQEGIAVRAGHHCTQALHRQLGAAGSIRASTYLYNTREDVDRFITALYSTLEFFTSLEGGGDGDIAGHPDLFL